MIIKVLVIKNMDESKSWIQYEINSREAQREVSEDPNWYETYYGGKPTSKKIIQALTKRSDEALVKACLCIY